MSNKYDQYLTNHKNNVGKAYSWLKENLPHLFDEEVTKILEWQTNWGHDASKGEFDEYGAYDAYFYGGNRSYQVVQNFKYAWLRHIHKNPHHWQYWILHHDEPNEPVECLKIPKHYVIEMICDWWSFSWANGDLYEIFNWWDEHKDHIQLHAETRGYVMGVLEQIRANLDEGGQKCLNQ